MFEYFVRMLHHCGLPKTDLDYIHGNGAVIGDLLMRAQPRSILFTGSGKIAEKLAVDFKGKVGTGSSGGC